MLRLAPRHANAVQARLYGGDDAPSLYFASPTMPSDQSYALLPDLRATTKPAGFASLDDLARRIHRDRRGEVLQLTPAMVRFRQRDGAVVKILAFQPASERSRLIGFAWLHGRPPEALQAALDRAQPATGVWDG